MSGQPEVVIGGVEIHALQLVAIIFLTLATVYFTILKVCYNSFSLNTVLKRYQERRKLEEAYNSTIQRRDDLMFHIDWAKSRGDLADARRLEGQMGAIEQELDNLDDKLSLYDTNGEYKKL